LQEGFPHVGKLAADLQDGFPHVGKLVANCLEAFHPLGCEETVWEKLMGQKNSPPKLVRKAEYNKREVSLKKCANFTYFAGGLNMSGDISSPQERSRLFYLFVWYLNCACLSPELLIAANIMNVWNNQIFCQKICTSPSPLNLHFVPYHYICIMKQKH
jgi:hypothetical protein